MRLVLSHSMLHMCRVVRKQDPILRNNNSCLMQTMDMPQKNCLPCLGGACLI